MDILNFEQSVIIGQLVINVVLAITTILQASFNYRLNQKFAIETNNQRLHESRLVRLLDLVRTNYSEVQYFMSAIEGPDPIRPTKEESARAVTNFTLELVEIESITEVIGNPSLKDAATKYRNALEHLLDNNQLTGAEAKSDEPMIDAMTVLTTQIYRLLKNPVSHSSKLRDAQ